MTDVGGCGFALWTVAIDTARMSVNPALCRTVGAVALIGVACGGSPPPGVNPCATRGATYLATFTEVFGNCGPIPSQVITVNPDGTITTSVNPNCGISSVEGCTVTNSNCTWSAQGVNFLSTYSVTFASDGMSASGIATLSALSGGQCFESYKLSYVRR